MKKIIVSLLAALMLGVYLPDATLLVKMRVRVTKRVEAFPFVIIMLISGNTIFMFVYFLYWHDKSPLAVVIILHQGGSCVLSVFTGSVPC